MKSKIIWMLPLICLLMLPTRTYAQTQNSISYITKGEIGKVSSSRLVIKNTYGDLQPGEYFTINLMGAEFDMDSNGDPRISSPSVEFDKRNKTSVTGRLLDNVSGRDEVSISFSGKILEDEAKIEIEGEDSHITSGTYIYATTSDSEISYKGELEVGKERFFYDFINLEPIIIKEKYNSAFQSLMIYEYNTADLIKIEVPQGLYELQDIHYLDPITFIVEDGQGNETRYKLGKDSEVAINTEDNILTFRQYNEEILQYIPGTYTIRIENVRLKASKAEKKQDVYMNLSGKWVEQREVLIAKQVTEKLMFEISIEEMKLGEEQRVKFSLQESQANTLLTTDELSFGLTDGVKINFKDDFKLELVDGFNTYHQGQSNFKIEKDEDVFTIVEFSRDNRNNLIRIQGEFTAQIPDKVEEDIRFFVSEPAIPGVSYATVFKVPEKRHEPEVHFTINKTTYEIDGESYPIDAAPYISTHDRIMVPLRYVAYALGKDTEELKWDGESQTITLEGDDRPMTINIGTREMIIGGETSILSEVKLTEGRTFVPVGEIARAFGREVKWDPIGKVAIFN